LSTTSTDCKISGVELQEKPVNQDAVFNAVADLLFQWPDDTFRGGFADPRQPHNRRLYAIGTPALVRFEPFPTYSNADVAGASTACGISHADRMPSPGSAHHVVEFWGSFVTSKRTTAEESKSCITLKTPVPGMAHAL
jgi:hypothetical protein